eukprot:13261502-Alexandrium_andersonii.AAC.1
MGRRSTRNPRTDFPHISSGRQASAWGRTPHEHWPATGAILVLQTRCPGRVWVSSSRTTWSR